MTISEQCIESYGRLKNLKLTGKELGIPWQTVYVHLRKCGIPVTGDKARYGSVTDRLAVIGESLFKVAVPFAIDNNEMEYQSTVDFTVLGYTVDVKTSKIHNGGRNSRGKKCSDRWAFCVNKQKDKSDFFVLYALCNDNAVQHVFLLPNEVATSSSTIAIPSTLASKWADYKIGDNELSEFFTSLPVKDF